MKTAAAAGDEASVAVVPLAGDGRPALARLEAAAAWFEDVSRGRWRPRYHLLDAVRLPRPTSRYRGAEGGRGRLPLNSQSLAADVASALAADGRARVAAAGGKLLLAVAPGFAAHTWHLPGAGVSLGQHAWLRRYAVVPGPAPLGTVAHELGHLLLGWPDLAWGPLYEMECLMARGATRGGGADPAPPCGPLLLDAGWRDAIAVGRDVRIAELGGPRLGRVDGYAEEIVVERRDHAQDLLVYTTDRGARACRPRVEQRIRLSAADLDRRVLGLLAPWLRIHRAKSCVAVGLP